jgi:cytochrome c oxidase subunit 3
MDYSKELSPEVKEKMKKNLVYVGIFSIIMMFAGLTSAYIVSMGGGFWLKYPLPNAFYISTLCVALSSVTFIYAIANAKKDKFNQVKLGLVSTLLLGLLFIVFQFKGFNILTESGIHPAKNYIMVSEGRYGDYFEIKYKGDFIQVNGNDYLVNNKKLSNPEFDALKKYSAQFLSIKQNDTLEIKVDKNFELLLRNQKLMVKNSHFYINDSTAMNFVDEIRLKQLAENIRDERGDFFARGKYGKDFIIYFKGVALDYKDRTLMYDNKKLKPYLQIKAAEAADTASSYLYILIVLHVLHIAITLLYLIRVTIGSFSNKYNRSNSLPLVTGGIFWHFLGFLWIYLLLFLIFIH